jgi:arginase family enzyme
VDAHPDLYDEFEGDKYSHACPFARVMEEGLADRLVQVGIRTMNRHQREQADRFGTEIIEMKDWKDGWQLKSEGAVYISFDMDGLDPASAPGVSHPEPGGFTTRQALSLIQSVEGLIGADIVEYNPDNDLRDLTARVAAKLVKELACAIHRRKGDSPNGRSHTT